MCLSMPEPLFSVCSLRLFVLLEMSPPADQPRPFFFSATQPMGNITDLKSPCDVFTFFVVSLLHLKRILVLYLALTCLCEGMKVSTDVRGHSSLIPSVWRICSSHRGAATASASDAAMRNRQRAGMHWHHTEDLKLTLALSSRNHVTKHKMHWNDWFTQCQP